MAWGAKPISASVEEWSVRLRGNDRAFTTLSILPTRKPTTTDLKTLFSAIRGNSALTDLSISGLYFDLEAAEVLAEALPASTIKRLAFGNKDSGKNVSS